MNPWQQVLDIVRSSSSVELAVARILAKQQQCGLVLPCCEHATIIAAVVNLLGKDGVAAICSTCTPNTFPGGM